MPSHLDPPAHGASALDALRARGVVLPQPTQVFIGREVPLDAFAAGAVLHPFARLSGAQTRIGAGAQIGTAGAATVIDSWVGSGAVVGSLGPVTLLRATVGPGAVLGCGVAEEAVFLGREGDSGEATTGYGFRARPGTLYEEGARSAQHTDTKMALLYPWVTLGSNLNWCDVAVTGGTGPSDGKFSEIGSGAIHFNFTPRGDKATGSVLGDLLAGLFLKSPRVFLGGNTSLIGPAQLAHGAVTVAGARISGSLGPGLHGGAAAPSAAGRVEDFDPEAYGVVYGSVRRVYRSQVRLIGALAALCAWYTHVRAPLAGSDEARRLLYARGAAVVERNLEERIAQLGGMVARLEDSAARIEARSPQDARIRQQRALLKAWPDVQTRLQRWREATAAAPPPTLQGALEDGAARETAYTRVVRGLPDGAASAGLAWLEGIAAQVASPELLERAPDL